MSREHTTSTSPGSASSLVRMMPSGSRRWSGSDGYVISRREVNLMVMATYLEVEFHQE